MTATFTRLWNVREVTHHEPIHLSDDALQSGGIEYTQLESIEARSREEAEKLAAERHPGKQINVSRVKK